MSFSCSVQGTARADPIRGVGGREEGHILSIPCPGRSCPGPLWGRGGYSLVRVPTLSPRQVWFERGGEGEGVGTLTKPSDPLPSPRQVWSWGKDVFTL